MDILIDKYIDKEPLKYKLSDDKVINITGEGGSGKSTLSNKYRNNPDYLVVDYDLIIEGNCEPNSLEQSLRKKIIEKYGQDFFKVSDENEIRRVFTTMYMEILDSLSLEDKTIILDGTQLRFIEDVNLIKGEVIILRPSIETCIQRSVSRKKYQKPNITEDELKAYEERRRHILYKLNPLLNNLIIQINNKVNQIANEQSSGLKH